MRSPKYYYGKLPMRPTREKLAVIMANALYKYNMDYVREQFEVLSWEDLEGVLESWIYSRTEKQFLWCGDLEHQFLPEVCIYYHQLLDLYQ